MIPSQTFESYPVFGDNATKVAPDQVKYANGFVEGDVYPAEWVNWAWAKNTQGITELQAGLSSAEAEINAVLTGAGKNPDVGENNQLLLSIQKLISDAETRAKLAAHPVGSLYWSSQNTDPSQLFGGTWQRIKDKFIWAAGDSDTINSTGGAKTVTLTTAQIPAHNHSFTGNAVTTGANNRGHTHKVTAQGGISGGAYKFTGTEVTSGANNRGHSHTLNNGNTSTSGTITTAGFRAPQATSSGMNNHSTGNFYTTGLTGYPFAAVTLPDNDTITVEKTLTYQGNKINNNGATDYLWMVNFNLNHTHTVDVTGYLYGNTDGESQNHTHKVTANGTISITTNPTFSGTEVTSGAESQNHTHSVTATGSIGSTGDGGSHNNMPPYIIKYCWERTA